MRTARIVLQAITLLFFLFLFIQTESKGDDTLGYPVKAFLDMDPLVFVSTLLSSHKLIGGFALSIALILITIALGRVFCGWLCPLGTLHNIIGTLRRKRANAHPAWHRIKYLVLVFLLAASVFTLQWAGLLDPISLLIRSLAVGINPAWNHGVRSAFDALFASDMSALTAISEPVLSGLKKTVLAFETPLYRQSAFIGGLFLLILGLNIYANRFWCKYICPLGAMLGVLSAHALLRREVSEACTGCGKCKAVCQGDANPSLRGGWQSSECLRCHGCDDVCPERAVSYRFGSRDANVPLPVDLRRRRLLATAFAGMVAVPLIKAVPGVKRAEPSLIRPPGAQAEGEFLARCVRCGECMKVCLTGGLQPAMFEAGLEGMWSPVLVPRIGYCEYRCTLCGQVCPTGAIKALTIPDKAEVKIGLAMIDRSRCLPYAHAIPCIVCEEVCPTPKKAIWIEEVDMRDRDGVIRRFKQPHVDLKLCVGCGICETKCPVGDRPAITVTSIGESRSNTNRLLL